jgi:hypothetical protein
MSEPFEAQDELKLRPPDGVLHEFWSDGRRLRRRLWGGGRKVVGVVLFDSPGGECGGS